MPHLNLTKGHGCGVDVLVVDATPGQLGSDSELSRLVARLCDRAGPIGGECVYFLDDRPADPVVWCFNPSGALVRASGFGIGVVGRLVSDRRGLDTLRVRAGDERFLVRRLPDSPEGAARVSVELPAADFAPSQPIIAGRVSNIGEIEPAFHRSRPVSAVAMPDAHLVAIVGRYDETELVEAGLRVAAAPGVFPRGADVTFMMPLGEDGEVFARTYERGKGLSRSCASGVAACRAVYSRLGALTPDTPLLVRTPGGPVHAALRVEGEVWIPTLEGNATLAFRAELEPGLLFSSTPVSLDLRAQVEEIMAFAALSEANTRVLSESGVLYVET